MPRCLSTRGLCRRILSYPPRRRKTKKRKIRSRGHQSPSSRLKNTSRATLVSCAGRARRLKVYHNSASRRAKDLFTVVAHVISLTGICPSCAAQPESTIFALESMHRGAQKRLGDVQRICASCSAVPPAEEIKCISLDCGWMFERHKAEREARTLEGVPRLVADLEERTARSWRTGQPGSSVVGVRQVKRDREYIHIE